MTTHRPLITAGVGLLVVVAAVTALGIGGLALERRAHERLGAAMAEPLAALLPDGQVRSVDVTDSPALLAERRDRVQQAVVDGTSGGHDVTVIVREYRREEQRAESVSWEVGGVAFAPGWRPVRAGSGAWTDRARTTVDGHAYEVTASVAPEDGGDGATVVAAAGSLTRDGAPLALAEAPAAVRSAVAPVPFAAPDPPAGAQVRRAWFDEDGLGVEMYAQDAGV